MCSNRRAAVCPHMRGEVGIVGAGMGIYQRFTPTCVGRLNIRVRLAPASTVYPHMRGEVKYTGSTGTSEYGLPPHAWGGYE